MPSLPLFKSFLLASCCVGAVCLSLFIVAAADDAKPADEYQSVWSSLSELLRRREYNSALDLLESVAEDPELQYRTKQIEADRSVIAGLKSLERLVHDQASAMAAGTRVEVSGIEFLSVRYEKDNKGDVLVLKAKATGTESRKRIAELPASTWLQIAGPRLETLDNSKLILGVFLGFDRTADAKGARKLLDEAVDKGANVTVWLARLATAESDKKQRAEDAKGNDDPLIGHWREVVGNGDRRHVFNIEFRAKGFAHRTIDPQIMLKARNGKRPNVAFNIKGNWKKDDDGTYRVTYADGSTAQITVEGDRFWGKTAIGAPLSGTRQVTKKK